MPIPFADDIITTGHAATAVGSSVATVAIIGAAAAFVLKVWPGFADFFLKRQAAALAAKEKDAELAWRIVDKYTEAMDLIRNDLAKCRENEVASRLHLGYLTDNQKAMYDNQQAMHDQLVALAADNPKIKTFGLIPLIRVPEIAPVKSDSETERRLRNVQHLAELARKMKEEKEAAATTNSTPSPNASAT